MKNIFKHITIFIMVILTSFALIACNFGDANNDEGNDSSDNTTEPGTINEGTNDSGDKGEEEETPITYSYALNKTSIVVEEEQTQKLLVIVTPEKEISPVFESSDTNIATVAEDGTVTGVKEGTATVTAKVDGETLSCQVTVTAKPIVYTYALDQKELELLIGNTASLHVVVSPEKAVVPTWTSEDDSIAAVSSEGVVTGVGIGTTNIHCSVDGEDLLCAVTVNSPVAVSDSSVVSIHDSLINLTDIDAELDTLYWEHYQGNVDKMLNAEDVVTNSIESVTRGFNDYKATLGWTNGSVNTAWDRNNNGLCHDQEILIEVMLTPNVKQIQIYTGAWRATGIATLSYNNVVLAESLSWTAEESGIARLVTFDVNVSEASTVIIKISPSAMGDAGNVSMVAVALLGNAVKTPTTSLVMTKTEMTGCNNNIINLTEKGNNDWYYLNYEGSFNDRKKDGSDAIIESSLKVEGNNRGWDYKASFIWTDGENYSTNPTDNDGPANGSNNFYYGAFVNISVNVNANTSNVLLYVSGWSSTYHIQVIDSNGNTIYHELVANEIGGQTVAYELDFAVNAQSDDCLTFILYRSGGANCGLAAVAVSNK